MLIIISQVILLIVAIALPLKRKRDRAKKIEVTEKAPGYKIDTDTSGANYAINKFGTLERINRTNWYENPEFEN